MKKLARIALYFFLYLGSFAISFSSLVYFNSEERAPFLIEKLPLSAEDLYLWVLRFHVVAASLALPGCLILSSKTILKRWPRLHRYCGRVVGLIVITLLVPSGFYLAFFAKGGWAGSLGFLLTGSIALAAMIQAIRKARARQYAAHRRFALHVLGQLSVAMSSRIMLYSFASSSVDPDLAYLISLWVPIVGTFVLVELIYFSNSIQTFLRSLYEQITHVFRTIRHRNTGLG